jgi:hypothetical protein
MFFAIFWTTFIPFGMVMFSLVADWLRRSFRRARARRVQSSENPGQSRPSNQQATRLSTVPPP